MAVRSGLSSQAGWGKETTYGTSATPTKFLPAGAINLDLVQNYAQGQGLYSGDLGPRAAQNVLTTIGGTGTLPMDVQNKDMGLLIQTLMGTTVTPVIQGAGPAYLQTHTLADPFGKSLTMQAGVTDQANGTTRPYTLLGTKVVSGEFTWNTSDPLKASFGLDAQNLVESTALASVSYSTGLSPFSSQGGLAGGFNVRLGTFGSETAVTGVTQAVATINRGQQTGRYYANQAGKKLEPILNDTSTSVISGTLSADYYDKTQIADLWASGATTSLVLESLGTLLNATFYYTFRLTIPSVRFMGDTPNVSGPDVINTDYPWVWLYDGTNLPKIEIIEVQSTGL